MKKCVFCAEEIQDDAVICRHCQRAVPRGVSSMSYRGRRYGVGVAEGGEVWGIWDLNAGGDALERFERNEDEWPAVWARYRSLEEGSEPAPVRARRERVSSEPRVFIAIGALAVGVSPFLDWLVLGEGGVEFRLDLFRVMEALVGGEEARLLGYIPVVASAICLLAAGAISRGDNLAAISFIGGLVGLAGLGLSLYLMETEAPGLTFGVGTFASVGGGLLMIGGGIASLRSPRSTAT